MLHRQALCFSQRNQQEGRMATKKARREITVQFVTASQTKISSIIDAISAFGG
jgi:hypothetical protein